jgi:hypothetical protein
MSATNTTQTDLLSSIHSYYSNEAMVSPAIICRRDVLMLNALPQCIVSYTPQFDELTDSLTFEMPYMSYIVPTSIVVELDCTIMNLNNVKPITPEQLEVTFGTEYAILNDDRISEPEALHPGYYMQRNICTITKEVNCARPCTYIVIRARTDELFLYWRSVRIYGQAISFV